MPKVWAKAAFQAAPEAFALAARATGGVSGVWRRRMRKRVLIGILMMLAGAGLLLPTAWTLFSPFLLVIVASSSGAGVTWFLATLGGVSLMVMGARRMLPVRAKASS